MQFAVVLHPAEGLGYWSEVPLLPGCASQGATLDAAVANTQSAIRQWLAYRQANGQSPPASGDVLVVVEV